ncbi:MAG: hypothetical protein JKX93_02770 [Rhizobiaceae bacterium]|nr:hypothetical protein [Rhizobiaceae bacterium]MBL4695228.1 hypothetical protein [Rhizobiaceae bacterium]
MQRLDIKSVRYSKFNRSVMVDGRGVVLEISQEALETLVNRKLSGEEAVLKVVEEIKRFTHLAERVPADDGKIQITTNILINNGIFSETNGG